MKALISWKDFEKIDIRTGTITHAEVFEKAINPAYILHIDFGELGQKISSAQITERYKVDELIGQQVVAVINFPAKQIANVFSECLVLGSVNKNGIVTLLQPERKTANGLKIS